MIFLHAPKPFVLSVKSAANEVEVCFQGPNCCLWTSALLRLGRTGHRFASTAN
jgi:hypothetical protein